MAKRKKPEQPKPASAKKSGKPSNAELVTRASEVWRITETIRLKLQEAARDKDLAFIDKASEALNAALKAME